MMLRMSQATSEEDRNSGAFLPHGKHAVPVDPERERKCDNPVCRAGMMRPGAFKNVSRTTCCVWSLKSCSRLLYAFPPILPKSL